MIRREGPKGHCRISLFRFGRGVVASIATSRGRTQISHSRVPHDLLEPSGLGRQSKSHCRHRREYPLPAKAALALGVAFNELAINAVK